MARSALRMRPRPLNLRRMWGDFGLRATAELRIESSSSISKDLPPPWIATLSADDRAKDVAGEMSRLMLDVGARLDTSVVLVEERCTQGELESYRKAVGKIMGYMLIDIMNP